MIFTVLTIKTRDSDPMNYDNFLLKYNDFLKILTGHATMIGKETGKIILWNRRSISCKICEYHLAKEAQIPDHDCPKNWSGSSKAMESYMAVSIRVITKLPNSEQSYKGKVKTHNYINRQNQSTTGKL